MTPRSSLVVELLAFLGALYLAYQYGVNHSQLVCEAAKVQPLVQAIQSHNTKAAAGQRVEKATFAAVAQNNAAFDLLDAEVKKYAEQNRAVADCGLDDDGLRLWRAANAGAGLAGAGQPDGSLPGAAAAAGQRQAGGPAGKPRAGGSDLPQLPQGVPGADRVDGGHQ